MHKFIISSTIGAAILAIAVLAGAARSTAHAVAATPWEMYLDCDTATAGIQGSCIYPPGTTSVDVAVVLKNVSGSTTAEVSFFNFDVLGDSQATFSPKAGVDANLNGNPDFSEAGVGAAGSWTCTPPAPAPDQDASPSTTDSFLSCYVGAGTGPTLAVGGTLVLGTVHYASIDGVGNFSLANVDVADETTADLMSCNLSPDPGTGTPGNCFTASVQVGASADTATATITPTPSATPTLTPTPCGGGACATPIGVPTGAPTDVLLLNSSTCVVLGVAFGGLEATSAVSDCMNMGRQFSYGPGSLQDYVRCLGGFTDVYGIRHCLPDNGPDSPLRVVPGDFSTVDLDRDQIHVGQDLLVLGFVSADYPVAFSTDAGTFIDHGPLLAPIGQSYACFSSSAYVAPYTGDPDCDGSNASGSVGDGVVVARIRIDPSTPRGIHHVTVTQGATSIVKDFQVVGVPVSITFATLAGKTSIETGATAPTFPLLNPLPTDCAPTDIQDALTGLPARPEKAVVLTKVLDSDGIEVVGALLDWSHWFNGATDSAQGGTAYPQSDSMDLGVAGVGFPQIVCGGNAPGTLTEDVHLDNVFDPYVDPTIHATYSIEVVTASATNTPTATSTPPADTATPTGAATAPTQNKEPEGNANNVDLSIPAANLWLCTLGPCAGPGEGDLKVMEQVKNVTTNPASLGLGAYEFEVEYDHQAIASLNPIDIVFSSNAGVTFGYPFSSVELPVPPGNGIARTPPTCSFSLILENDIQFGCVTTGQVPGPNGSFDIAMLDVVPQADLSNDIFPGNNNGVLTVLKDNNCELADTLGHPVVGAVNGGLLPHCGDLAVTVRILEGDLNLDCKVDVADEALMAYRYGSSVGMLLYSKWFDLEPQYHDGDIDIKDLQKVFGRDGSTCQNPIPAQPPLPPPSPFNY